VKNNMQMFLFGASLGRLHSKVVVIDRKLSVLGSMNLDPRSATINTEMGVVVDSPTLALELARLIDIDRLHSAYEVRLDAQGGLQWLVPDGDTMAALQREPDAPRWLRWLGWLLRPLVPEAQL
jgi:putative cardiolipin synthase